MKQPSQSIWKSKPRNRTIFKKTNIIMKTLVFKLLMVLVLSATVDSAYATDYYFSSTSGNDSHSASQATNQATPWKSIDKLNSVMGSLKPGDRILFKRGDVFYGSIRLNKSGAQGRPITFGAYGNGAKPVITSLVTLNNWVHVGNGIYESHNPALGADLNVVLIDNKIQEMGRYPNSNAAHSGYLTIESTNGNNSVSNGQLSSGTNWQGAEIVIRKSHWTIDRHPVNSHSGNTIIFQPVSGTYKPVRNYGFFIQDHIKTLDKYGEWYYNRSSKKLSVYFGSKAPSSATVQAAVSDNLVTNSSKVEHIVFDNL